MASTDGREIARPGSGRMGMALSWPLLAVGCVVLATSSCTFPWSHRKPPRVFVPPPVVAKPAPQPEPPVLSLPETEVSQAAEMPPAPESLPSLPGPPAPAPPKRPAVAASPKPAAPATPAEQTPTPRLGQIYTADQAREYNRAIDESLDRVRKALAAVSGRNLTPEQNQIADSIRTFQRQAESAREQDLVFAVSLARRADLLAKDLLDRLP
jgi:hypothetical protein